MSSTDRFWEQADNNARMDGNGEPYSDMQNIQNLEKIINEGLRMALEEDTPDHSLNVFLEYLGKALNGQRTYIFEQNEVGGDDNTYEWVADGVIPEIENLQNLPPEVCASWYQNFRIGKHIIIKNLEDICETDPLQYEVLKKQNIHSLVVVPLYNGEKVIGFYGVDNPPAQSLEYASNLLHTAAYFIISSLKQRNLFRTLQKQSYDVLHALSVDYLGIYQINFDTDDYIIYRNSSHTSMDWADRLEDGYEAAMKQYISNHVVSQDQERLQAATRKEYVLSRLKTEKKFFIRYQEKDEITGLRHMELHFSTTGKIDEGNSAIFAQRDVNAIVKKEESYRLEARRSLEDILEGAKTGIWTIELEEDCRPRMYADRTMQSLLGIRGELEPEECYQHWFKNIDPDYVDMVQTAVREILETGRSEVIYPWYHPDLGKIYVRCGGVPDKTFQKRGNSLNGYHQDITEITETRKKQEQTIMDLLEKVGQANSAKSEFLSRMSHDLRTPINGILGMLDIIKKSPDDSERQKECHKKIRISTEYLLSLVNDVLQVSKLDKGIPAEEEKPFDLRDILDNCITILSVQAAKSEIELTLKTFDLQHHRLIGNSLHLEQILMNIIDNAIKYNRPHGSVMISVKENSCKDGIACYCFTVKDTGIGITEEFKKHIFELFTQEDQGARTHYNGSGLGMTIVKKLIDQMNGQIEINSKIGVGSEVLVTLSIPIDENWHDPSEDDGKISQSNIAGMHVLVVEDNEINCEIMKFVLEDADAEVVTAIDGKAAVDTFSESAPGTFDCILMDLMMPRMSGYEATRMIRSTNRTDSAIPIIALSANAFEEDIAMAKDAGMNEHLVKPVDMEKLFEIMSQLRRAH